MHEEQGLKIDDYGVIGLRNVFMLSNRDTRNKNIKVGVTEKYEVVQYLNSQFLEKAIGCLLIRRLYSKRRRCEKAT